MFFSNTNAECQEARTCLNRRSKNDMIGKKLGFWGKKLMSVYSEENRASRGEGERGQGTSTIGPGAERYVEKLKSKH